MIREPGYKHRYDTGQYILSDLGVSLITGIQIRPRSRGRQGVVVYWVTNEDMAEMAPVSEAQIIGHATKSQINGMNQGRLL